MRTLFLLLVLANLGFYAWSRYAASADAAAPEPLERQVEPEKLKIIAPADVPPARVAPKVEKPAPVPAVGACIEWGSFALADAPRAAQALEPLGLGTRLALRRTDEVAGWWVFIPSQGSRQAALKKAAELKDLGVEEYFIVQEEGEHRWALSLGIFRTEEAAQARLEALADRGVRSARLGARDTAVPKIWLQVKSVDAPLQAQLNEIARRLEGSELRDCAP